MNLIAPLQKVYIDNTDSWSFVFRLFDPSTNTYLDPILYTQITAFIEVDGVVIDTLKLGQGITVNNKLILVKYNPVNINSGVATPQITDLAIKNCFVRIVGSINNYNVTLIKMDIVENESPDTISANTTIDLVYQNDRVIEIQYSDIPSLIEGYSSKLWQDKIYTANSTVSHGEFLWSNTSATAIGEEPGVSPKWVLQNKAQTIEKYTSPYKVVCNSNFNDGTETGYDSNFIISGLRITVNGLESVVDALKMFLDVRGTYLLVRVYEGSRVIDVQKIAISKKEKKQFIIPFTHRLNLKTGIDYTFEVISDNYLGFLGVTLRGSTIPYKNGFYKTTTSGWLNAFDGLKGIGFELLKSDTKVATDSTKKDIVHYKSRNSFFDGANSFSGWGFAVNFDKKSIINAIILRLDYLNYNDSITIKIWKRNINDNALINESDSEVFIQEKTYPVTAFQYIQTQQDCLFSLESFQINANEKIVFEIIPNKYDTDGTVLSGKLGIATYGDTSKSRNFMFCYKQGSAKRYVGVNSNNNFPSCILLGENTSSKIYASDNYSVAIYDNNILSEIDCGQGQTVTETINVTINPSADNSPIFWTQLRNSSNQALINITSISNISGKTLGVDYEVNFGMGRIRSLGAAFTATITVTMYYAKRVAIAKNVLDNSYVKIDGTSARTAALEYPIVNSNTYDIVANFILRWRTLVEINQSKSRVFDALLKSKSFIKGMKFFKKLNAGQPLVIASYADSIYANQAGSPTYAANGTERDRIEYLWGILTDDYLGTVPISNGHVSISLPLQFISELNRIYTSAITYLNFSIAGTNSGDGLANSGNPYSGNGRYPARISEIVNSDADLVILAFGMNEIGSNNSYWNLRDIISQLQSAPKPKEVILIECFKPSAYNTWWTVDNWNKTNNQIRLAAEATGSGYVPITKFLENGWEYSDDIGRCMQNMWNHPSDKELENYSKMFIELIK